MNKLDKYKRKTCPQIKDMRPKGMKSVPVIGYELLQIYKQHFISDDLIAETLKALRE